MTTQTAATAPADASSTVRVAGLDTIRLSAAIVVAMSHGMLIPPRIYLGEGTPLAFWSGQIGHMLANGPAAVAVFFVISGVCIHMGRESAEQNPLLFLARRAIRIGIPLISILLVAALLGSVAVDLLRGVLWSVYCEISYYLAYPLLLMARRRWSLELVLCISVAASGALLLVLSPQELMWQYGWSTAVVCYPLWILGAVLAERVPSIVPRRNARLWTWRIGMLLAGAACAALRYAPWATNLPMLTYAIMGGLAVPFLARELAHAKAVPPSPMSENLGKASYSLYLVHIVPLTFVVHLTSDLPQWLAGPIEVATVATCALVFFTACERPALQLARVLSFSPGRWRILLPRTSA